MSTIISIDTVLVPPTLGRVEEVIIGEERADKLVGDIPGFIAPSGDTPRVRRVLDEHEKSAVGLFVVGG